MYLQLRNKKQKSATVLYIHCDEKEFLNETVKWREELLKWKRDNPDAAHLPLGRLEVDTCMVDLLRHLTKYYVESTPHANGRIMGTLQMVWPTEDAHIFDIIVPDMKIHFDKSIKEYQVRVANRPELTYYTDDKEDAKTTMAYMKKNFR